MKKQKLFFLFIIISLFSNSICFSQADNVTAASIAEQSGIAIEKVESGIAITEKYSSLIENMKQNEAMDVKSKRQSINSLQKVLKAELLTAFGDAETLNTFQKVKAQLNRQNKMMLNEEDRTALNKEITEYLNKAYHPIVKEERLALDSKLAKTDKEKLAEYRLKIMDAQKALVEKQQACLSANDRRCRLELARLKKSVNGLKKEFSNWSGTVEHFEYSLNKLNNNKANWLPELNGILAKYYQNVDTADYPIKALSLLKFDKPMPYLFLNTDKIEMELADYSNAGKIIWINQADAYCQLEYSIDKKARVLIHIIDANQQVIERIEEAIREPGIYSTQLSKNYETGLYFIRLILNGNDVDAGKFLKS